MPFTKDVNAQHLGVLCKIKLTETEEKTLGQSLEKILKYVTLLDELDTTNVKPCTHILETITNVMDEDEPRASSFDSDIFFENAPSHVGNMIKSPPIVQTEE